MRSVYTPWQVRVGQCRIVAFRETSKQAQGPAGQNQLSHRPFRTNVKASDLWRDPSTQRLLLPSTVPFQQTHDPRISI